MRTKLISCLLVLSLLVASIIAPRSEKAAATPTVFPTTVGGFDISIHLDHVAQNCVVEVSGAPANSLVLLVAQVTSDIFNGTITQSFASVIATDSVGRATFTSTLSAPPGSTFSEADVYALYADSAAHLHETQHWILTTRHLNSAATIQQLSMPAWTQMSLAVRIASGSTGSSLVYAPSIYDQVISNAFVSELPYAGVPPLSGAGVWFSTGPSIYYQSSSGPAGVFTAN